MLPPVQQLRWQVERALVPAHRLVYRLSGGRLLGSWGRAPVLLLTTTGRRSGRPRTVPLLYLEEGASLVVAASDNGAHEDPDWFHNLRANAQAVVTIGTRKRHVRGSVATPEEKARLWPRFVELYAGYDAQQRATARDIPVVILRPVEG